MPTLIEQLAAVCRDHFVDEKILIVPSLAIGHQIADRLAVESTSWVNLRSETVRTLVDRVIGFDTIESGMSILSRAQALALVEEASDDVLTERSYFHALSGQPGLYRAVQATLDDLRQAHVRLSDVSGEQFEDDRKRDELLGIQQRYERLLQEKRATDRAALLRAATDKLRTTHDRREFGFVDPTLWLILDGIDLTSAEEEFLALLAGDGLQHIGTTTDYELHDVTFVQAIGEENEIRACFRELLRDRNTLDDAELIYTHPLYLPLAWELANEYDVACTFADGVAASFTRPGQAVLGFLQWLGSDFDAPALRRLAASGLLLIEELSSSALARSIREAAIGWGRDRTVTQLEKLLAQKQAAHRDDGTDDERAGWRAREVARVESALAFARRLVAAVPMPDEDGCVPLSAVAAAASQFAQDFAYAGSEIDSMAKAALCRLLTELSEVGSVRAPLSVCARRLGDAVQTLHIAASNPRPGHLHITSIALGGYAKRSRTFIAGMDSARFPGQPLQDPVLLDEERTHINDAISPGRLPLIAEQSLERLEAFRRLLARVGERDGALRIAYSSRNLLEDREQFPGEAMLELYRRVSGHTEADYPMLIAEAQKHRAGFVPEHQPASETEWWLAQRGGGAQRPGASGTPVSTLPVDKEILTRAIHRAYPWLADGAHAEAERDSDRFTKYDGKIGPNPQVFDPRVNGTIVSCSRITSLAACPYRYFLERVLGVQAEEELERDPLQWLNAMEFGSLFHSVAETFFNRLEGSLPSKAHHDLLLTVAEEALAELRDHVPPPNEASYLLRQRELHAACDFLLNNEIEHSQLARPAYFELPFGFNEESLCALASREPLEIMTDKGAVKIRGRIDRVDERADGSLEVWDYKTGGTYKYNQKGRLYKGQVIQHAVYARALEQITERKGDRRKIAQSGYFFPTEKGGGERIVREGEMSELSGLLSLLFDMVADGSFAHASAEACKFCDFQQLCDLKPSAERAERKLGNAKNDSPGLQAWRKVAVIE